MTPGQAAYEQWNAGEGYNPKPNSWARIGPQERKRWEAVAQAVINQFLDSHTCGADPAEPKCMNCP